jgi:hypothetical protein
MAARGRWLAQRREDIDVAIQNIMESRDANKRYFDQEANFRAEDVPFGDMALAYKTKIEQSHLAKLVVWW